ncbi:MAG: hypothetical protein K2R98_13560 [Gemmataceae bacterium]|nr:hypothetical protein [Gemmataceae bacterium]
MTKYTKGWPIVFLSAALATGCGEQGPADGPPPAAAPRTEAAPRSYRLSEEPAAAKGVIAVRKEAKDDQEVVVVGHVAGSKEPIIAGRAAFTIVDLSLEPCEDERPWVYCCTPKEELIPAMVMVKCVDEQGKTVAQDARSLLGIKEWSTVVVRGRAVRDDDGNFTAIVASGIYVKP